MSSRFKDRTGERVGILTAIKPSGNKDKRNNYYWIYRCDCGKELELFPVQLKTAAKKSCGCDYTHPNKSHGMSHRKVHKAWAGIKTRVYSEAYPYYSSYGGRGITMQDSWVNSFENFYSYIGDPPKESAEWTLERLDVNGNYEEGNIKWETVARQTRNRSKRVDNKSGVTGVGIYYRNGVHESFTANWKQLDGADRSKSFNIGKHGKDLAFKLACEHRTKMIESLNQQGAGYSDSHGQDYK